MSRVSENSTHNAIQHSLNKTKESLENLQLKGSTLKKISRPSDDPAANIEALSIKNVENNVEQYNRNIDVSRMYLNITEGALEELTNQLIRLKELAIAQASDTNTVEIRKNVVAEVEQIRNHVLALANQRIGNRYIFAGHKTLTTPFNNKGEYFGDDNKILAEISRDHFIALNIPGREVFHGISTTHYDVGKDVINILHNGHEVPQHIEYNKAANIFSLLNQFVVSLETGDGRSIGDLLPKIDLAMGHVVTARTRIGATLSSLDFVENQLGKQSVESAARKSKLIDADVAELFSNITRQQDALKTAYQAGQSTLNKSLLDFLK